jgi:hypothetical protein
VARWDERLLSRERAARLAGPHPLTAACAAGGMRLLCGACGQSCGTWRDGDATSADDVTAAVLRHLVTAHGARTGR